MAEYIEREAATNAVVEYWWSTIASIHGVARAINKIPAADVAPVRHGRWERSGHLMECQSCGEIYSQLGGNAGKAWHYCPNCGCKMDLEVSE